MPAVEFLTFRVPPEVKRCFEMRAEHEKKSLNMLGNELFEQWLSLPLLAFRQASLAPQPESPPHGATEPDC
jgi:hypothetical protein